MSAVAALSTTPAESAATTRPARRRPVPPSLPRGLGRLAGLAVATPVTVLAAHTVGAVALPLVQTLPLVLASALLLVVVALGVRLRGILTGVLAVVATISVVVAFVALLGYSGSGPGMTDSIIVVGLLAILAIGYGPAFVLLLPIASGVTFAVVVYFLSRGAGSLARGVTVGVAAAFAAIAWPLLTVVGFGFLAAVEPLALLWPAVTAPVAWLAATAARKVALRPGVVLALMRDTAFRVLVVPATLISAVWIGQAVEIRGGRAAMGTPLESLAVSAGWAVALLSFAMLGWAAWRMPRWLVVGQLWGRFEAVSVSETLVAAVICYLVPLVLWRLDAGVVLGRDWLVALAAALSYGWIRLWFAAPAPVANVPLWILVPNGTRGQVVSLAARAAGAWRAGQVTVLGVPEDAPRLGGEHLWAAGLAREMEALFPLRPVHLDDWVDAQPDAWPALPVRELYAPADLWPQILGTRMEASARTLVLHGPDAPHPFTGFLDRRPTTVAFLPRSSAPTVRPGTTPGEITDVAEWTIDQSELRNTLRVLAPPSIPIRRFVVIFCTQENIASAERVARLIHAQLDAEGHTVDCHVVRSGAAWWKIPRLQLGSWRLGGFVLARSVRRGASSPLARRLVDWFVTPLLGEGGLTTLEVVVWEASRGASPSISALAVDRFIAVRAAGADSLDLATMPRTHAAGEIHLARGDSAGAAAETVARKLLANELTPLARAAATDSPPEQAAKEPTSRPTPATMTAPTEAANALSDVEKIPRDPLPPDVSGPSIRELERGADAPTTRAERPTLFVSGAIVESTAHIHRQLLRELRERLPGLDVIGSDAFDDLPDEVRRERVGSVLARAVATLVVISRAGVRNQFVQRDVAAALKQGGRVIPVLLDGATMPATDELPPELVPLTRWNALQLDALHGGPEAVAHFPATVAEALGVDAAPSVPQPRGSLRIYLCAHPEDGGEQALGLRLALADRFGPDSTHADVPGLGAREAPPGALASQEMVFVTVVRRSLRRVIAALARWFPESALATGARRFLQDTMAALTRGSLQRAYPLLVHSGVVVVVIGPQFARVVQEGSAEHVDAFALKTRLSAALDARLLILPVLVDGAAMPRRNELPDELLRLTEIQAFEVRAGTWNDDIDRLGDLIEDRTERRRSGSEPA